MYFSNLLQVSRSLYHSFIAFNRFRNIFCKKKGSNVGVIVNHNYGHVYVQAVASFENIQKYYNIMLLVCVG